MKLNTVIGIALALSINSLFGSLNASSIEEKVGAGVLTALFGFIAVISILYRYRSKKK